MNAHTVPPCTDSGRHWFTVDDVLRMIEVGIVAPDGLELLDGELIHRGADGENELRLKSSFNRMLIEALPHKDWFVISGTLHLAEHDAPRPDFYVLARPAGLKPVDPDCVPLIIEIADTSLAYDLGRKTATYARYGLAEYWVVDVNARVTHVLTVPENGAYRTVASVAFSETLIPAALPTLAIRFDDLVPPTA